MAGAMTEAAGSGALASAGVRKLYLPTALLKEHLPSGMGSLERVPRLTRLRAVLVRCEAA